MGDLLAWRQAIRIPLEFAMNTPTACVYEVRPRKDHRGVDLVSDALPFRRLWYG
jgi:hypothetical protein